MNKFNSRQGIHKHSVYIIGSEVYVVNKTNWETVKSQQAAWHIIWKLCFHTIFKIIGLKYSNTNLINNFLAIEWAFHYVSAIHWKKCKQIKLMYSVEY